jgi:hypothetical protein
MLHYSQKGKGSVVKCSVHMRQYLCTCRKQMTHNGLQYKKRRDDAFISLSVCVYVVHHFAHSYGYTSVCCVCVVNKEVRYEDLYLEMGYMRAVWCLLYYCIAHHDCRMSHHPPLHRNKRENKGVCGRMGKYRNCVARRDKRGRGGGGGSEALLIFNY